MAPGCDLSNCGELLLDGKFCLIKTIQFVLGGLRKVEMMGFDGEEKSGGQGGLRLG